MNDSGAGQSGCMKAFLIGCGSVIAVGGIILAIGFIWLLTGPEGGVRTANDMEEYATAYIAQNGLLEGGENLVAYYDVTVSCDGTEAAILTSQRVLYHLATGNDLSIRISDVQDIKHRKESVIGDVIEIYGAAGQVIKIEIAPLNNGETFLNALMNAWELDRPRIE
jgi:hypothetical protein